MNMAFTFYNTKVTIILITLNIKDTIHFITALCSSNDKTSHIPPQQYHSIIELSPFDK